jgi:hypothetical protein
MFHGQTYLAAACGLALVISPLAKAEGYYGAIEGGGRFLAHADARETGAGAPLPAARFEGEFDAGSAVGFTFGKYLQQNLRTEVEMQWSSNALDYLGVRRDGGLGATLNTPALSGQRLRAGGDLEAIAFMVNAFYEVDYGLFRPYFGAGVGLADLNLKKSRLTGIGAQPFARPVGLADDNTTVLAYQAGAGVALPLSTRWTMAVDYRYLAGEDAEFDLDAGAGRFRSDFGSHNVLASLRYDF